jgi:1-deoxy-D-xylulose-5-phosphate reductoisomerase
MPAVLNAANEQAVALFLAEKIQFLDIPRLIQKVCDRFGTQNTATPSLDDILQADGWARRAILDVYQKSTSSDRIIALK